MRSTPPFTPGPFILGVSRRALALLWRPAKSSDFCPAWTIHDHTVLPVPSLWTSACENGAMQALPKHLVWDDTLGCSSLQNSGFAIRNVCIDETQSTCHCPTTAPHGGPSSVPAGGLGAVSPCAPCAPAGCSIPSLALGIPGHRFHGAGRARGTCGRRRFMVPRVLQRTAHTADVSSSSSIPPQQRGLLKPTAPGSQHGTLRPSVLVRCHNSTGDNGL